MPVTCVRVLYEIRGRLEPWRNSQSDAGSTKMDADKVQSEGAYCATTHIRLSALAKLGLSVQWAGPSQAPGIDS